MTDAKQDRIMETLKQRITQLEGELQMNKQRLLVVMDQSEEYKRDMESLRTEAHSVVGQWEKEVTDVRNKLAISEGQLSASLREKEELQKQIDALQKILTQYTESLTVHQATREQLEKSHADTAMQLEKSKAEFTEALQQIKEYESLTVTMQKELQGATESEAAHLKEISFLRSAVTHATNELEAVRMQKDEISVQAEKLLRRINELKEINEQLYGDTEVTQQKAKAHMIEMENIKAELAEVRSQRDNLVAQVAQLSTEKETSSAEVSKLAKALADSEAAAQQHLNIISGLEKDVQELQDSAIVQARFLQEFQQQKEHVESELVAAISAKEDAEAQFTAIKECYSNALVEANDYKMKVEETQKELRVELEKSKADMAEALMFYDHRYDAAMGSVKQLGFSLQSTQARELVLTEQVARGVIQLAHGNAMLVAAHDYVLTQEARITTLATSLRKMTSECASVSAENVELSEKCSGLQVRAASTAEELASVRKSLASLESKAAASATELKGLEEKNASLENSNLWLKDQVEAMRTELGDLDELLNANLNQMQAENDKHIANNIALQATVDDLRSKEADYTCRIEHYEQHLAALEGEFAAQAKTLDITEADLRTANEELGRLQTALKDTKSCAEVADQRITELSRTNALLSSQQSNMKEQMKVIEEKHNLIVADKRREIEGLRLKINQLVNKAEEHGTALVGEHQVRVELERTLALSKETIGKLRKAIEELKERCGSDANSLKQLIAERDDLIRSRDDIVERYNRLHDAFRNIKRETHGKVAEELRKMIDLSEKQENELQRLRSENVTMKKSLSMFVMSAQPKAEAVFMERLNLTEGPLRHPKKRSVAKSSDLSTQ